MIARLCRFILALQLAAAALAALCAIHFLGTRLGIVPAALCGALAIALIHPLTTATSFALSRIWGSQTPQAARLGLGGALLMYVREYLASMRGFDYAHPFLTGSADPEPAGTAHGLPILFVHGYFCSHAIWLPLMRAAAARGYRVGSLTLEPAFKSIDLYPDLIEARSRELLARHGSQQLIVVCHSMGGIAVRAWMRRHGHSRVRHVYALGSPHYGTHVAHFSRASNAAQMRRGSDWLATLLRDEPAQRRRLFTNFWSHHDNIVFPQESAALEDSESIAVAGLGHVSLVYARSIWELLFERLASLEALAPVEAVKAEPGAAAMPNA